MVKILGVHKEQNQIKIETNTITVALTVAVKITRVTYQPGFIGANETGPNGSA